MTDLHRALARDALRLVPPDDQGAMGDDAMTAKQFACMALVAMGVAEDRRYGCDLTVSAGDVADRLDPDSLWLGDAAFVVLVVAQQLGDLSTAQQRAREEAKRVWRPVPGYKPLRQILEETIASGEVPAWIEPEDAARWMAAQRSLLNHVIRNEAQVDIPTPDGPMRMHPDIFAPFEAVGMIEAGRWAKESEVLLWRFGTAKVPQDVLDTLVDRAAARMPEDVARAVELVWVPPDMAIVRARADEWWRRHETRAAQVPEHMRAKVLAEISKDEMCRRLDARWADDAAGDVSYLVQTRWRAELGWDSGAALLPLFHDRLAGAVAAGIIEA